MATEAPTSTAKRPKKAMSPSDLVLFPTPVLAVKGAICFNCLQSAAENGKLDRCKGCKRVSYCSFQCQKQDWKKAHKNVCPILKEINQLDAPCEPKNWEKYRSDMWKRVDAFRSHPKSPKINEERILQYQPHCATCHRNIFQLPTESNKLTLCPTCNLAHHCASCDASTSTHLQHCSIYTAVAFAERFSNAHFLESLEPNVTFFTKEPRTSYMPLSQAKSWRDYYTVLSDQGPHLGPLLTHTLDPVSLSSVPEEAKRQLEMSGALKAGTEKLSMMITILAALEATRPTLQNSTAITLHIIGATAKELDALMLFEELLHLLPNIQKVHCVFIGPQMPRPDNNETIILDVCPPCSEKKRIRSMSMFKGTYIEYMRSLDVFRGPDLAVLFHTGHLQEDVESWLPTIRVLAHAKFPSAFTTYNKKEMQEETAGLKRLGAKFAVEGARNRWSAMRPLLEVAEEEEGGVFYMNMYWYVLAAEK